MTVLRVLHVISTLKAYGAERQVLELLPALDGDGMKVGALAVYDSNLCADDAGALRAMTASLGRRGRSDYRFMPALVREIRAFRPDVVHTHTHVGKYWGRPAARLAGARAIVHTEHNPCDPRRSVSEKVLDRAYARFTNRFVLFFPEQGELLAKREAFSPEKIAVIPNGLSASACESHVSRTQMRRSLSIGEGRIAIMMVGRLEHQKNHELAFHAIARLSRHVYDRIDLFVIGAGSAEPALRELARDLKIAPSTRFVGYRSDAAELLAAADVLLNTSRFEGMPITFIEAMLGGTAIVTTPWCGADSMLERGALGFVAGGWEDRDVAQALEAAIVDDRERQRRVDVARDRARSQYSLARTASAHRRLYETVARAGAPS